MSRSTEALIKSSAAAAIAGGLAFMAVNTISRRHSLKRRSTAKMFRMLGALMESI